VESPVTQSQSPQIASLPGQYQALITDRNTAWLLLTGLNCADYTFPASNPIGDLFQGIFGVAKIPGLVSIAQNMNSATRTTSVVGVGSVTEKMVDDNCGGNCLDVCGSVQLRPCRLLVGSEVGNEELNNFRISLIGIIGTRIS
jgi:hypothetical protein